MMSDALIVVALIWTKACSLFGPTVSTFANTVADTSPTLRHVWGILLAGFANGLTTETIPAIRVRP